MLQSSNCCDGMESTCSLESTKNGLHAHLALISPTSLTVLLAAWRGPLWSSLSQSPTADQVDSAGGDDSRTSIDCKKILGQVRKKLMATYRYGVFYRYNGPTSSDPFREELAADKSSIALSASPWSSHNNSTTTERTLLLTTPLIPTCL